MSTDVASRSAVAVATRVALGGLDLLLLFSGPAFGVDLLLLFSGGVGGVDLLLLFGVGRVDAGAAIAISTDVASRSAVAVVAADSAVAPTDGGGTTVAAGAAAVAAAKEPWVGGGRGECGQEDEGKLWESERHSNVHRGAGDSLSR